MFILFKVKANFWQRIFLENYVPLHLPRDQQMLTIWLLTMLHLQQIWILKEKKKIRSNRNQKTE